MGAWGWELATGNRDKPKAAGLHCDVEMASPRPAVSESYLVTV